MRNKNKLASMKRRWLFFVAIFLLILCSVVNAWAIPYTITRIPHSGYAYSPDINNKGEIVWASNGNIVSNYLGILIDSIKQRHRYIQPAINDRGEVVCTIDDVGNNQIYSTVRGVLTPPSYVRDGWLMNYANHPDINNNGVII